MFFFTHTVTSDIYTLSLHDALPICRSMSFLNRAPNHRGRYRVRAAAEDRKSTRLNSSHGSISYAVFCLKKKKGQPGRAPERILPLDITSLLLHVIFDARFLLSQ